MEMQVDFLFVPNQKVETSLGEVGIIDMCGVQSGGTRRY